MGDKLVDLAARMHEAPPIDLLGYRYDACKHEHVTLDTQLRTVACVDCGMERVDPFDVLLRLCHDWRRWESQLAALKKASTVYQENERAKWERARDRHVRANPAHVVRVKARSWGPSSEGCRVCRNLEMRAPRGVSELARP